MRNINSTTLFMQAISNTLLEGKTLQLKEKDTIRLQEIFQNNPHLPFQFTAMALLGSIHVLDKHKEFHKLSHLVAKDIFQLKG